MYFQTKKYRFQDLEDILDDPQMLIYMLPQIKKSAVIIDTCEQLE